MRITKKAVTRLFLCFVLALSVLGATAAWLANTNKMANAAETVAMDDKINLTFSDENGWIQVDFDGFTVEWNSWHDADDSIFSANNGVDPLAYTYVNGRSLRELYGETDSVYEVYTETDWIEAYVVCIWENLESSTIQLKAGFTLVAKDGTVYVLENDTAVYGWIDGAFGVVEAANDSNGDDVNTELEVIDAVAAGWGHASDELIFIIRIIPHSSVSGDWNSSSHTTIKNANGGIDILQYICVNGEDARTASNKNNSGETNYKGEDGWLAHGGKRAPVFVETNSEGAVVRIDTDYSTTNFEFTVKAGFALLNVDGETITVDEDVVYTYNNGVFELKTDASEEEPEIPEEPVVDGVDYVEYIGLEDRSSWPDNLHDDIVTLGLMDFSVVEGPQYFKSSVAGCWYRTNSGLITANNGIDMLEYVYLNGTSARALLNTNATDNKATANTGTWLSNPEAWPIAIETGADVWIRIDKTAFGGDFTFTLKAGFALTRQDGERIYLSKDVSYVYTNGVLGPKTIVEPEIPEEPVVDGVDYVEYIGLEDRSSWPDNLHDDIVTLGLMDFSVVEGPQYFKSSVAGCWYRTNSGLITANNGIDMLEYVYLNGTSARALLNTNATDNKATANTGTWLSNPEAWPIAIETGADVWIRIDKTAFGGDFTFTLKAGFALTRQDGERIYLSKDVSYAYTNGVLGAKTVAGEEPEIPDAPDTPTYEEVDVTDTLKIEFAYSNATDSKFKIFLTPASELLSNGYWNIYGDNLTVANNGVDIMDYIYINGQNIRDLSDDNRTNNTYPVGDATGWFTNSDQCRPVFVETNSEGIWVNVLHAFSCESYTLTIKAGFAVLCADGNLAVVKEDLSFSCANGGLTQIKEYTLSFDGLSDTLTVVGGQPIGELPAVPYREGLEGFWTIDGATISAETVFNHNENKTAVATYTKDVTETVDIEFSLKGEHESQFKIFITPSSALSSNGWWNIYGDRLTPANNGVDIMDYIYVNDQSIRALSDDNRTNNTYPLGNGSGWFTNSDQCRPVFVETNSDGIWVRVLHSFSNGEFKVTLKAGFAILDANGTISVIKEDVSFLCSGVTGAVTQMKEYTLSFDGLDETMTVVGGQEIGELPEAPYREGYIGFWVIDGVEIYADAKYMFDGDRTAVAFYEKDLSLLERVDIKDTIFLGDWGVPETESDLRYLWINDYQGLPTVLYKSYWNDNGVENADKNLGIDIMQYIYIDGVSVRDIVTSNQLGETAYKGVTEPLDRGKVFAPVVVVTDISGIAIKVLTEYKTSFVLTIKAGFSIVSNDVIYYVSEDVDFMVYEKNDTVSQGRAYNVSFECSEGDVDSIVVAQGVAMRNLPAIPEKEGLAARWTIDGVVVNANTIFEYGCDKVAVAEYYQKYYTLTFEGAEFDPITVEVEVPMSNLPEIPEKEGYIAYWTIDGEEVDSTTVFSYDEDKIVVATYFEIVDIKDVLLAQDWGSPGEMTDLTYIRIGITRDGNGNLVLPTAFTNWFWNDDVAMKSDANFGCDLMSYIFINGESIRDIVERNAKGDTQFVGTTFPFDMGLCYAPVTLITAGNEVFMYILKDFADQGTFTITFKAGFTIKSNTELAKAYVLSEDVEFYYHVDGENSVFARDFTLTFEGVENRTMAGGSVIGELPEVPAREGYVGVWTINGNVITEETVFGYNASVTAIVSYTAIDYTITINRANGVVETLTFNDLTKEEVLASIKLTESNLFYAYSWQEALPSELDFTDYTFVEISTEQPASTRIISYSLTIGTLFDMNVYAEVIGEVPTMKFVMGGEESIVEGVLVGDNKYLYKLVGINAYELAEEFSATLLLNGEDIDSVVYSVEAYLNKLAVGDISDELKTLIADVIDFAQAAEAHAGVEVGIQDIDGLTATEYVELTQNDSKKTESTNSNVAITSANVSLEDSLMINVMFRANDITSVSVKVNGESVQVYEFEEGSGVYALSIGAYCTNVNVRYTVEIYVGEDKVQTFKYSVKSYLYEIQGNEDDTLCELLKTAYNLSLSAKAYVA